MSDEGLRDAIARMATDDQFRDAVTSDDPAALASFELTEEERSVLRSLVVDESASSGPPQQLGARLSTSSTFFGGTLSALHVHDAGAAASVEQHPSGAETGP